MIYSNFKIFMCWEKPEIEKDILDSMKFSTT